MTYLTFYPFRKHVSYKIRLRKLITLLECFVCISETHHYYTCLSTWPAGDLLRYYYYVYLSNNMLRILCGDHKKTLAIHCTGNHPISIIKGTLIDISIPLVFVQFIFIYVFFCNSDNPFQFFFCCLLTNACSLASCCIRLVLDPSKFSTLLL